MNALVRSVLTSNPSLKRTKIPDPPSFSHSAMGRKNLENYRPMQFFIPDSSVFSDLKNSLPFGRYLNIKFVFFYFLNLGGSLVSLFWKKQTYMKKRIFSKVCSAIPQYKSNRNLHF
jgi:hypothetical protein